MIGGSGGGLMMMSRGLLVRWGSMRLGGNAVRYNIIIELG